MTLSALNALERDDFVAALGHLFEHSPWVAEQGWASRPFAGARELHAALCAAMRAAPADRRLALIRAHPDLAGRLAQEGRLTAESSREQASAGLHRLSAAELEAFQERNAAYRAKFGFPFVICARLNDRRAILEALDRRLEHTGEDEVATALEEIEKIAWLRLQDVIG